MPATTFTLPLTPAQRRQALRINAGMAVAPRLKPNGWRLALGMRLNDAFGAAAGRVTAAGLARRGVRVSHLTVPGRTPPLGLRLLQSAGSPRALVVDLHGGGWVVGSAALNDRLTGHLAAAGLTVASVDYRLLDEARGVWMADAVDDCAAALRWALDDGARGFGVDQVFVIGESAGAHLAALAVQKLRDQGVARLPRCIFVQGVFDLSATPSARAAGRDTLLFDGPNLFRDLGRLTPDRDEAGRRRPDVSPLYADLSGLPPALFVMGELDPFRDDSRRMADAWSAHASATLLDVPTAPHAFQHFGSPAAALAQAVIRDWIDRELRDGSVSVDNSNP